MRDVIADGHVSSEARARMGLATKQSSSRFYKTIPAGIMNDKQKCICVIRAFTV